MTEKEIVDWIWERAELELGRERELHHPPPRHATSRRGWLHARAKNVLLSVIVDCPPSALTPNALAAMRVAVQRPWFRSGLPTGWFPSGLPAGWRAIVDSIQGTRREPRGYT